VNNAAPSKSRRKNQRRWVIRRAIFLCRARIFSFAWDTISCRNAGADRYDNRIDDRPTRNIAGFSSVDANRCFDVLRSGMQVHCLGSGK